jgi:hypothetical protein
VVQEQIRRLEDLLVRLEGDLDRATARNRQLRDRIEPETDV